MRARRPAGYLDGALAALLPFWLATAGGSTIPDDSLPPAPLELRELVGERLTFRVRWGPIPAGEAVLAVEPGEGRKVRLVATARTLPAIDPIYRVRDRMVSTVRPDLRSFIYEKDSEEGKRERHDRIKFDLKVGKARYTRDEQPTTEIEVPADVRDPLSSLYAFRLQGANGSEDFALPVSDGKKLIEGVVVVVGREEVKTPAGTFQTIVVQPRLEGIGGVFRKSPGASITIWMTDDRYRRPVRMASSVAVGSFVAELVELETGSEGVTPQP